MKQIILSALFLLFVFNLKAQDSTKTQAPPCSDPAFAQFDFWVGDWDLTWQDSLHGSNTITKVMDDCVIMENFDSSPSGKFRGMSVSTYNINQKIWQQTWVDNNGAYLDFKGGLEGDKMILSRSFEKDGNTIMQRMVWYNISDNSFDWNWESSKDKGENWKVLWQIHYERRK